jgi:hypothetical protein
MLQKLQIGMFFSKFVEKNMPTKLLPYSESEVGRVGNFISPDARRPPQRLAGHRTPAPSDEGIARRDACSLF